MRACPRKIITMIPREQRVYLACLNREKGKTVKDACGKGCFACMVCVSPKLNKQGAVYMKDNLPVIRDPDSSDLGQISLKCPAGCYATIDD